jgi:hypothetical protein
LAASRGIDFGVKLLRRLKRPIKTFIPIQKEVYIPLSGGERIELFQKARILKGFEIKGGIGRDGILYVVEGEKEQEARKGSIGAPYSEGAQKMINRRLYRRPLEQLSELL